MHKTHASTINHETVLLNVQLFNKIIAPEISFITLKTGNDRLIASEGNFRKYYNKFPDSQTDKLPVGFVAYCYATLCYEDMFTTLLTLSHCNKYFMY